MQNDDRGGGGGAPDMRPRSSDNWTNKTYSTDGGIQAPSGALDPWAILAGEVEASDVERVLAILNELEPGGLNQ